MPMADTESVMRYKTARALEMAVKEAAKKSGRDVNRAIRDFYHDRLLERVFSESEPAFVLKGGRSMLARTARARYTNDTDVAFEGGGIEEAVAELVRLSSRDLSDHLEYRLAKTYSIVEDQEYREGRRVVFEAILGGTKKVAEVSVDLVVNVVPLDKTDVASPVTRLELDGLPRFDWRLYPVEESIADKVCATMVTYLGGRPSSRVRDLVDLVIYLTTEEIDGDYLSQCLNRELRMGHMGLKRPFAVPDSWMKMGGMAYRKIAESSGLPEDFRRIDAAEALVSRCVDRAMDGDVSGLRWVPERLEWEE